MADDINALRERIRQGITDQALQDLVPLVIPSRNPNLFNVILQQNHDLGEKERQERSLDLFLKEVA